MKVIRVGHTICDSTEDWHEFLVPDELTEEQIDKLVAETRDEIVKEAQAVRAAKALNAPPGGVYGKPDYTAYPDNMTMAEINAAHAEKVKAYKAWEAAQAPLSNFYYLFAKKAGAKSFWEAGEDGDIYATTVYWGHNHGLQYYLDRIEKKPMTTKVWRGDPSQ